jgi:hypothetical protein
MLLNSKGKTKTIIRHNGRQDVNEVNWDANYDGAVANVSFDIKDNGKSTHKNLHLTNENLANLFTVPSVDGSLDERLIKDFQLAEKPRNGFQVIKYPISVLRKKTRSRSKVNNNKKKKKKNLTRSKRN